MIHSRIEMYCNTCERTREVSGILFERDELRISCDVCFHYTRYELKKREFDSLGRKIID